MQSSENKLEKNLNIIDSFLSNSNNEQLKIITTIKFDITKKHEKIEELKSLLNDISKDFLLIDWKNEKNLQEIRTKIDRLYSLQMGEFCPKLLLFIQQANQFPDQPEKTVVVTFLNKLNESTTYMGGFFSTLISDITTSFRVLQNPKESNTPFSSLSLGFPQEDVLEPIRPSPKIPSHQPQQPTTKKKGKKKSAKRKETKKKTNTPSKPQTPQKSTPIEKSHDQIPEKIRPISSISFIENLEKLHTSCRSVYLEQAINTLHKTFAIHELMETRFPLSSKEQKCNLFIAFCSHAHHFLEQTYNFALKRENKLPLDSHNLKLHDRELYGARPPPKIIQELYNTSNWYRYFYHEKSQLRNITTSRKPIPQLVKDFIALCEGEHLPDLLTRQTDLFQQTLEHAANILSIFIPNFFKDLPSQQLLLLKQLPMLRKNSL